MSPISTPNHERTILSPLRIRHLARCLPLVAMLSSTACDVEDVEHGSAADEVDSEEGSSGFEESEDGGSGAEEPEVSDDPCEGTECAPVRDRAFDLTADPDPAANTACGGVVAHNHGGDLFPGTYQTTMGCDCAPGTNHYYYGWYNVGNGSCSPLGWETPDPTDCRVRMQINRSGGYANGTCNLVIDQVPAGTCYVAHSTAGCNNLYISLCVCDSDPYCCSNQWDALCAWEVTNLGCG